MNFIYTGIQRRKSWRDLDIFGFLLFYFISGIIVFGPPSPLVLQIIGLNPVSLVNDNLHVGIRALRDFPKCTEIEILPLAMFSSVVYMFLKYVFCFIVILVVVISSAKAGLQIIISEDRLKLCSDNRIILKYEGMLVLFTIIRNINSQNILYVIVFTQVLLTMCFWLTINCFGILPAFITAAAFLAFAGGLAYTVLILTAFAHIRNASIDFIRAKREEFRGSYSGQYTRRKYSSRKWRALQPLPIYCGRHFSINKQAVMNYINVLNVFKTIP